MTEPAIDDPREWKIFPRNLTARADYIVPGNPVSSRPETGVDNSYPGLEMDARNIQKMFFPGAYFEVYRDKGARLTAWLPVDRAAPWHALGLTNKDLEAGIYLWILKGRRSADQDPANPPEVRFIGDLKEQGLYAWRMARDLFLGRVAVVIGRDIAKEGSELKAAAAKLEELWSLNPTAATGHVTRAADGSLSFAVLLAERTRYLDEQGVLDPDVYQPGELTRTLCTPWTYDFRDCQCFYWASNKPDVVSSEDGSYPYLNFQRKNRDIEPQTQDFAYDYVARRAQEIDYPEMMTDWQQLRPVVNGRECGEFYVPEAAPEGRLMDLDEIRAELAYLATVEHALAVQYLYAYYSIDAPYSKPAGDSVEDFRIWQGAREIFEIAIDEMRHFRWANEVLKLLSAKTTAQRALKIGRNNEVPYFLSSLSADQLQWFIDLEKPSRSVKNGLDGMYVGILRSLQRLPDAQLDPVARRRAVEIVKLIIDEGEGHFVRFSTAQQNLAFYDEAGRSALPRYIRRGNWSAPASAAKGVPFALYGVPVAATTSDLLKLQQRGDSLYQALLNLLAVAFAMRSTMDAGRALGNAIGVMFRLNDVSFQLAEEGNMPLFTLPDGWGSLPPVDCMKTAQERLDEAERLLRDEPTGTSTRVAETMLRAQRQAPQPHEILEAFRRIVRRAEF